MENSKKLLQYALNHLQEANISDKNWNMGGGTVLAEIYQHRLSKDIDIFVDDPQLLARLSPRINDASSFAKDYEEANQYIKLVFTEGKVDFISSGQITDFEPEHKEIFGQTIPVSDPVEIVCKKLYFRGSAVLARDLFDLACVYNSDRKNDLLKEVLKMPEKMKLFNNAFVQEITKPDFLPYSKEHPEMILPSGQKFIGKEIEICQDFLNNFQFLKQEKEDQPSRAFLAKLQCDKNKGLEK